MPKKLKLRPPKSNRYPLSYCFLYTMERYYRLTPLDRLPSEFNRLIICGEYGWQNVYHYLLHSCYAQPGASYWLEAAFELWRNTAMLVMLTTVVLCMLIFLTLLANATVWSITQGVKSVYATVTNNEPMRNGLGRYKKHE